MYGTFGRLQLGDTYGGGAGGGKLILCKGDPSDHGGEVTTTNQDDTLTAMDKFVSVDQALHSCPIKGHGIKKITAVTKISFHNGKLILTELAYAECGARMTPPNRRTFVE